ncbi:hypothetical protein GC163_15520 [bacterium]|nr:hypothetical protein [bacterium]
MDAAESSPLPVKTDLVVAQPTLRQSTALWFWTQIRKIVVFMIGSTVIALGIAMLLLPGPGWLTVFGGLAILATEFAWARWALKHAQARAAAVIATFTKPAGTTVPANSTTVLPVTATEDRLNKVDM